MRFQTLITAALLTSVPMVAAAQSPSTDTEDVPNVIEEVTVIAQRREERLVDVPISINAISQQEMDTKQIVSMFDLGKSVTSLRFEGQAPSFQPTLRGVGTLVQGGGVDASVAVYIDGIYLPNTFGMNFDLPNVENVQVLKGPQGTLFGRNATGGAILITTAEPSDELTGRLRGTYAEFEDKRFQGFVSGPLSETFAVGLSVTYRESPGYTTNIVTGADDAARNKMYNIRPDIRYTNHDNLNIRLVYEHNYAWDTSFLGLSNPDNYAVANFIPGAVVAHQFGEFAGDQLPVNENESDSVALIVDWDINELLNLKSVTNYREDSNEFWSDADMSNLPLLAVSTLADFETFSQEFTLAGQTEALDWVAGAYYYNSEAVEPNTRIWSFGIPTTIKSSVIETESIAVFADLTWEATDGLFLTLGARYNDEEKDLSWLPFGFPPVLTDEDSWNSFTPRAVVRYQFAADTNVYASYNRGFKPGAFAGFPPDPVEPEQVDAYEVGYKRSAESFSVTGAVFYYDYTDFQVTTFDFATGLGRTINAPKMRNYGAELEMSFRPTPAWVITLAGAYLDAKFTDFTDSVIQVADGFGQWIPAPADATGTRVPRSPEWSGNIFTSYDINMSAGIIQLAAYAVYSDSLYNLMNEQFEEPSYTEVGANASFTTLDGHWRFEAFVNNLTDHIRRVQYQGGPLGTYALYAPPRVFGASISYNF